MIISSPSAMSKEAQEHILDFVNRGGKVLILPVFPETDLEYQPCSAFSQILGDAKFQYNQPCGPALLVDGTHTVYGITAVAACEQLPENARVTATDPLTGKIVGFELPVGAGKLMWFGGNWEMTTFDQPRMLEHLLEMLDGNPCVKSSNRNLFTSLWTDDDGRRILFVMNLYSGRQRTNLHVFSGGEVVLENVELAPMEVKYLELTKV